MDTINKISKDMGTIEIKRIYEPAGQKDGKRILIDRLWPRGIKKESAALDNWMKDVAPSTGLRKWFNHDPSRWKEFSARYITELKENNAVDELKEIVKHNKAITLLYAAHDEQHNHALVLREFLEKAAHK